MAVFFFFFFNDFIHWFSTFSLKFLYLMLLLLLFLDLEIDNCD